MILMLGKEIIIILLSYALGCIATGYYIVKLCTGKDIRKSGSGSTGARNVARVIGKKGFVLTFTVDVLKGIAAIFVCKYFDLPDWAVVLSILAVTAGHIFPIQLSFHGGKGVGVTIGAMLIFDYYLAAVLFISFAILYLISRHYMLSGITALAVLPAAAFFRDHSAIEIIGIAVLIALVLFAHRSNIGKLFNRNTIAIESDEHQDNKI